MNDDSFLKVEPIKRSNSMFLHPSPDIDIKVIKQIGDYSLGTELGSGAFGKVVLGKHILTNELVAIKILDKMILSHTPDDYQSVKQEINILKSVKHKHIVQLYEVLQTSRHIFIIMEYCEGKDLLDYILTKSKLSEEESLKYFQQLINALFYLHSQNIAHRDIKIDNMLLDRNRDLKLVDFGLSTKYPDDNLLDQPCGTVVYAAPEVLQGREYHGMLADVWSSGIVLYGMLSGYLPFGEQDDEINRKNIIMGKIKFPSYFSDCVKDLLMHMLDLDPMTRYTLQEVRSHPWFNLIDYKLIPGIIIGYNIIPVDEKILNLCVTYNCDKEKVRESVVNNKYNSDSALYYLLIKKLEKKGFHSVSDFCSDEFINFVLDDNNLIDNKNDDRNIGKNQESEIKYNININANKNCSAPPDGKAKTKEEKYDNYENKENININNNNLITPKNSESQKINKKINFDETPKGVLSFIINTPSFEETNKDIFNIKTSHSNKNKITKISNKDIDKNSESKITNNNNDNDSKKTNKNTSSNSRQKYTILQVVNVNDFQITPQKNKEKSDDKKIININEINYKVNTNNIFIDENIQTDNENDKDYKILNVFHYNNTNNNENDKILIEKEKENEEDKYIFKKNINLSHINDSNNLNISNNNNIIDNSIEIIYDKSSQSNEVKIRNNDDILETPLLNSKKIDTTDKITNGQLISSERDKKKENKNNEFIIETPPNNKENNKEIIGEGVVLRNKNTLSKQKNYIDRSKNYSEKNKNEEKNKLDMNKIKEIRKINLFQEEIKEENNAKKDEEKIIFSSIIERESEKEKELNDNINISLNQNNSKNEINTNSNNANINISINNIQYTPIKRIEMIEQNLSINEFNNNIDNNKEILKDILINENKKENDNINNNENNNKEDKYDEKIDYEKINNEKINNDNVIKINNEINNNENINNEIINNVKINNENINNENINKEIINNVKINNENINNENTNKEINNNEIINKEIITNEIINKEITNNQNNNNEIINNENIKKNNENISIENINKEKDNNNNNNNNNNNINNENINKLNLEQKIHNIVINNNDNNNANIQQIKEEKCKNMEENIKPPVEKAKIKPKTKIVKRKEKNNRQKNDKKKNPIINSIIKNYKAIVDTNKSIEKKNKKSKSRENNNPNINYSSKNKNNGKKSEKEIISIKVVINKNLLSKEKNKNKNSILKNRTEQPDKKIKSIYRVNMPSNVLSKSKFTTVNKKPTVSIFKKKLITNCYTNPKNIQNNNKLMNSTHIKSSSIHILGTMVKRDKTIKKNIIYSSNNNSNSLFRSNNLIKSKNKQVTSSKASDKSKRILKNNCIIKSYNNKYMKLFKSTQYKNNNLLFTNKIDKTNLNKKFDEIAYKINKNTKINKNKNEDKKIPLWKYIQSDLYMNNSNMNNKSSSPQIKNDNKKGSKLNNQKPNSNKNKTNDNIHIDKNGKLKDNYNININKLNNINNKSTSLSKDKNINVFFINIKNYINKNENSKRANKNYIESSATNYRYRSPYEVRELSESEKNKYLNQKTRYNRIPWKIKKKAFDEKIEIGDLYRYYMNKNNNPFKKNNKKINKKVNNIKPINNKGNKKLITNQTLPSLKGIRYNYAKLYNNININDKINLKKYQNAALTNKKNEIIYNINKKYNQSYTPQYVHKKSYFPTFKNINQRNVLPNKLFQSINNTGNKNNNNIMNKNYTNIFDLSCLFINEENLNDCYQDLIYKLIKKNICFVQKPNKTIRCFKNGLCYEIEIDKIDESNKNENKNKKNIYCFKIYGKNGFPINKIFKDLLLE